MRIYHGERTEQGCKVTVDGMPLRMQSDLSGNATTAFDWGFIGSGQLSLALLSDFLGDDQEAKAMCQVFEEKVISELPGNSWTMTESDLANILARLPRARVAVDDARPRAEVARPGAERDARGVGFGDMPVQTAGLVAQDRDAEAATS